tara:strand:- start:177 stop:830 length:654 start_codon:yes stop_codon:yes gene_type:complete
MKHLLLPLLAAIALPTAVNSEVDPEIAEMCMKAVDFQGCVNAMTGEKPNEFGEGTRKFVRKDGSLSVFNPLAISAMEVRGEYGRYFKYRYFRIENNGFSTQWSAEADCLDYTANWKGDTGKEKGWRDLKTSNLESSIEAVKILDEFCPQMDRLVREANSETKEYYRYPITASVKSGGYKAGGSGTANQMRMQQQIHGNKMQIIRNDFNNWHKQEFGY